ncbi:DnaJ domain-containing protein, partial [Pavlovales sp. CCMP2436]
DLYADLGVSRRATAEEIKAAYRARALASHPDKARLGEEEAATEAFTKIASAYETLSDPEKRRQYDAYGPNYARRGGSAAGPRDPFAEFFAN